MALDCSAAPRDKALRLLLLLRKHGAPAEPLTSFRRAHQTVFLKILLVLVEGTWSPLLQAGVLVRGKSPSIDKGRDDLNASSKYSTDEAVQTRPLNNHQSTLTFFLVPPSLCLYRTIQDCFMTYPFLRAFGTPICTLAGNKRCN